MSWMNCTINMWEFYGGISRIIVCDNLNMVPFQKRDGSRMDVFINEEKDCLRPLPAVRYEIGEWVTRMGASVKSESITDKFIYDSLLVEFNDFNMRNYLAK